MKALLRQLLDRIRSLRTVAWLAGTSYAVNVSRAVGAVLARMVLDPVAVGLVNTIMLFATLMATVSLGTIYGVIRRLPTEKEELRAMLASRAFAASTIEAIIVALLVVPLLLPLMADVGVGTALFWMVFAVTIVTRMLAIQESILLARGEFGTTIRTRLLRALEPFVGVASATVSATPLAFLAGAGATGVASLAWRRNTYFPPGLGFRGFWREGLKLLRSIDGYSFKVSLDRMTITIANYIDAATVVAVAGPATLAGYYLGINIRGAMSNLPTAIFWQRWARSVAAFDATGVDRYTRGAFLLRLWLLIVGLLAVALALLWLAVITLIPEYQAHYAVAALASLLCLPIALSTMMRGQRMLDRRVGALALFSTARIVIFLVLVWLLRRPGEGIEPSRIAFAGYAAAAAECVINATDIAVHLRRPRFMLLVAALVVLPGLVFLPWLIA